MSAGSITSSSTSGNTAGTDSGSDSDSTSGGSDSQTGGSGGATTGDSTTGVTAGMTSGGGPKFDVGNQGGTEGSECELLSFMAEAEPPEIMFVLDKSGSMDFNMWLFNNVNTNRWDSLYQTVDAVLTQYEDKADFGAELYPTRNAVGGECNADNPVTMAVAPLNRDEILGAIPQLGETVEGQTPMGFGVTHALDHLAAIKNTKRQAMILVADGGVTTSCNGPNTSAQIEALLAAAAAQELYTYVVGIDADTASLVSQLNLLAVAGGQPLVGAEQFYNAQDGNALLTKMGEIVEGVLSCSVTLDPPPDFPDLTEVEIDGMIWPKVADCNTEDGWIYSNPFDEITLCGMACQELKDKGQVDISYQCPPG